VATALRCSSAVHNLCYGGVSSEFVLPANAKRHEHWRKTMRRLILFLLALALLPIFRTTASAQMSNMPADLRARLAEINPTWGKDILGNVATTLALYTPILAAAPKDGVRIERDLAYGPDALHRLDLTSRRAAPACPSSCSCMVAPMSGAAGA
jgi:hypothetical protein